MLLTVEEVAGRLRISRSTAYEMIALNEIQGTGQHRPGYPVQSGPLLRVRAEVQRIWPYTASPDPLGRTLAVHHTGALMQRAKTAADIESQAHANALILAAASHLCGMGHLDIGMQVAPALDWYRQRVVDLETEISRLKTEAGK